MYRVLGPTVFAAGLVWAGGVLAAELKSGLQVGDIVKSFSPQHVTGDSAGKSACLV